MVMEMIVVVTVTVGVYERDRIIAITRLHHMIVGVIVGVIGSNSITTYKSKSRDGNGGERMC